MKRSQFSKALEKALALAEEEALTPEKVLERITLDSKFCSADLRLLRRVIDMHELAATGSRARVAVVRRSRTAATAEALSVHHGI